MQYPGRVFADACLVLSAARANLVGLGHVVLERGLGQAIVIGVTRSAWRGWRFGTRAAGVLGTLEGHLFDLEEMTLSRSFLQPFPPRAEDVAAVEIELPAQFVDRLLVFLDGLVVELAGLIEGGSEVFGRGMEVFERGLGDPPVAERTGSAGRDMREDRPAMTLGYSWPK